MPNSVVMIIIAVILVIALIALAHHSRYHRSTAHVKPDGEQKAMDKTEEEYGTPVKTLYTSAKILTIHHKIDITDDNDNVAYRVSSKAISIHDKTTIVDAADNEVAFITRKILTIHELHHVTMDDGTEFDLSNEILHIVKTVMDVKGIGWQLIGDFLGMNFRIVDENQKVLAVVGRKYLTIHDKTSIDIYDDTKEKYIVAIIITLQHILADRESVQAAEQSGSSSNS